MRTDTQTILSLHKKVVTHNTRISVTHSEPRTWNLHIRSVSHVWRFEGTEARVTCCVGDLGLV